MYYASKQPSDADDWVIEMNEWVESLHSVRDAHGPDRSRQLLDFLVKEAARIGVQLDGVALNTPYRNTIPSGDQPPYPGDIDLERRIENINRWNAMAMVLRAGDDGSGVGGHIATYASAATMLEVGFNHVFRSKSDDYGGDTVNIQAHSSPGIYARAFLEGRLTETQLRNYRRELQPGGGLPSYPHPRRMPDLWPCPTASMGLSTVMSIYVARFMKYLEHRGLKPDNGGKVWCFIGDGETDEPEVIGSMNIAARENLDNIILIVNCNLQRLDGPVRGNAKIIQELESVFRGLRWNVHKVVWGSGWDTLLERDSSGVLQQRMDSAVDGDYQLYSVLDGAKVRDHWNQGNSQLAALMSTLSDEEVRTIKRGGHDRKKVFAAFDRAMRSSGQPTAILMKTIKGYGLGHAVEGQNVAHQKKKMSDTERQECAARFGIPLTREQIEAAEFYHPGSDSPECRYILQRRQRLGGFQPTRSSVCMSLVPPDDSAFADARSGRSRASSTTMSFVRILSKLLRDANVGKYIVPIVADEARTFGMEGLFRQVGIYSPKGQRYQPVDKDTLSPYREIENGQILQEGICEAGAMASFYAAGTSWSRHGIPTIPFYIFYSMFGFQRVGDMIWACADGMCRGFLVGATAGRTTLNGEGVQHQDGHSLVVSNTVPNLVSYDPAFAYEIATIVQHGIQRMFVDQEDAFYYLTVYNEPYEMPAAPAGVEEGIIKGIYRFRKPLDESSSCTVHLLASGSIMQQAIQAQNELHQKGIASDLWSVTSYNELYRDAVATEQQNRLHGTDRVPYISQALSDSSGLFVAVSDYMKILPLSIGKWVPGHLVSLGTDGFGLSESRADLRRHFEIDASYIVATVEHELGASTR